MTFLSKKTLFYTLMGVIFPCLVYGAGRSQAGLTLLEAPGARAAALGEAFSTMREDVTAFAYNPASLYPLETGQASFMLEKGISDDTYGHFLIGYPRYKDSFGLSVSHYNGGKATLYDGVTERNVTLQSDLSIGIGYATAFRHISIGATAKYFKSELADTASASAFAGDIGLNAPLFQNVRFGLALQNIGSKLQYVSVKNDLPRMARAGITMKFIPYKYITTLLIDSAYSLNNNELIPSAGLETWIGPLALRAGYKGGSDLEAISFGTGFRFGNASLDYAFGLVDQLDSRHRVSFGLRFGNIRVFPDFVNKPNTRVKRIRKAKKPLPLYTPWKRNSTVAIKRHAGTTIAPHHYVVKKGDTLKSISKKYYGYDVFWDEIYNANRHILNHSETLPVGQKIILPRRKW
ncbi:hypothetical protein BVX98_01010 [bacterium F11]|nr:hypothetical protein BVX98_01010 [bacterium F11]